MGKNCRLILLALTLLAGGLLGGCSIEETPHAPTFATDIRPIMLSRCVRCHGAGGRLNKDDHTANPAFAMPVNGYFDRMEDDCPDSSATCRHGLGYYTMDPGKTTLLNYIHGTKDAPGPMPPLPAPRLTSHQLGIIDLWLANGAPAE